MEAIASSRHLYTSDTSPVTAGVVEAAQRFKPVKPQRFLFWVCPCQKRAALIRNRTVRFIGDNETAAVAYLYLQSRKGLATTRLQTAIYSIASVLLPLIPFTVSHAVVSGRNALRYKQTAVIARRYLETNLDERTFRAIDALEFDTEGLKRLVQALKKANIPMEVLRRPLNDRRIPLPPPSIPEPQNVPVHPVPEEDSSRSTLERESRHSRSAASIHHVKSFRSGTGTD